MKKVNISDMDVAMSVKGKGTCKRNSFNDFSNLIDLRDHMRKVEPRKPKRKKSKSHKRKDNFGRALACNQTHILIPCEPRTYINKGGREKTVCEQWVVLYRIVSPTNVKGMYPNVAELFYSYDGEAFPNEKFTFNNVK